MENLWANLALLGELEANLDELEELIPVQEELGNPGQEELLHVDEDLEEEVPELGEVAPDDDLEEVPELEEVDWQLMNFVDELLLEGLPAHGGIDELAGLAGPFHELLLEEHLAADFLPAVDVAAGEELLEEDLPVQGMEELPEVSPMILELMHSARTGRTGRLRQLISDCGVSVSSTDRDGKTALHWAAKEGHADVAGALLALSPLLSLDRDRSGSTPLEEALRCHKEGVARVMRLAGADMASMRIDGVHTPLVWAVNHGHAAMARFALEDGGDAAATVLRDVEADLAAKSYDGKTLLHLAVQARHGICAQVLLDAGADVAARDGEGRTALHLAVAPMGASESNDVEVAKVLLQAGADVAARSNDGRTALHFAAQDGRPDVAKLLLRSRASAAATDAEGQTPLHLACRGGRAEIARVLQNSGGDFFARDNEGRTPQDRVRSNGHAGFAALLREETRRARHVAFAMGLHPRVGGGSVVLALEENLVRMVLDEVDRALAEAAPAPPQPALLQAPNNLFLGGLQLALLQPVLLQPAVLQPPVDFLDGGFQGHPDFWFDF